MASKGNNSRNSNGSVKGFFMWSMTFIGCFMLGFFVLSQAVALLAPKSARQTAEKSQGTTPAVKLPSSEPEPLPKKSATIGKDDGVTITPDKMDESELQKPENTDNSMDGGASITSGDDTQDPPKPARTHKKAIAVDPQPADNGDNTENAASTSAARRSPRNTDNGDVPTDKPRSRRIKRPQAESDASADVTPPAKRERASRNDSSSADGEPVPPKRKRKSPASDSGEKSVPSSRDSGVQKGEGIDR